MIGCQGWNLVVSLCVPLAHHEDCLLLEDYHFQNKVDMIVCLFHPLSRGALGGFTGCSVPAPRASFYTTFLNICGRGESLGTTTCLKTVVGVIMGMLPVPPVLLCQQSLLLRKLNLIEIIRLLQRSGKIWPPSVLGILPDLRQWCLSLYGHIAFSDRLLVVMSCLLD